ncbi:MAG: hypothetical protein HEP70_02110 [Rhodobiaceae bacterium]|nr:hypothetical protein [Rhodobiaceae bacterium]
MLLVRLAELPEWERDHLLSKDAAPLGPPAWVSPSKPLYDMRLALITTAGLHFADDAAFEFADATYRAISNDEDANNLMLSHSSSNFDRTGFQQDVNVVFPLDRFKELVDRHIIGSLAAVHYSFMGAGLLPQVYEKTVRTLAGLLKQDNVDAVFILPVCPNCTRAASAIAYYLESEGIMTTGVSLVREISEVMQPPRMVWTSFPFGYPLGKAGDADFQHQVICQGLALLEQQSGPVLEDFPLDVPHIASEDAPACSITLARPSEDTTTWTARLANELLMFKPWYDLSRRRRGRTMVGISGTPIDEIIERLAVWLDDPDQGLPDLTWFKQATEDAKAYYGEALIAQPGDYPPGHTQAQFWNETDLGAALKRYHHHFAADPELAVFARIVGSREAVEGSTGSFAIGHENEIVPQTIDKD